MGLCLGLMPVLASMEEAPAPAPPAPPTAAGYDTGAALRSACWNGDLPEVRRLLAAGAPLEGRDSLKRTPLFLACHHGSPELVKFLLDRGARADVIDGNDDTTVGQACEYGHLEAAKLMLAAGADINRTNKWGRTPLMLASREGRDDVVAWLISQGVDVNFDATSRPAIFYATWKEHVGIVKLLLNAGAKTAMSPELHKILPNQEPLVALAAGSNDATFVDLLLDHGAPLTDASSTGRTALMAAAQEANAEMVDHLLEKGADPNAQNSKGETALMLAINYQPAYVLENLLDHGAKLEAKDGNGRTALMWAAYFILNEQVHVLVNRGADINATDAQGETALTLAGDRGDTELVEYLKSKGATRTDVHIIGKPASNPALTPAQAWALAAGAIYAQYNGDNPRVLGYDTNAYEPEEAKRELKRDWGVTDKARLLSEAEALRALGHRTDYQKYGDAFAALDDDAFEAKIKQSNLEGRREAVFRAMRASSRKWKDRSGLAWDLCRRANLICNGYAAGLINADEAWQLLLANAKQLQGSFGSWQEMSDNFLDGREIWAGQRSPHFEACARLLLNPNDANSVWNQVPWGTDLGK